MLLETCKTVLNLCQQNELETIFRSKFNDDHLDIKDFTLNELLLYAKSYQKKNTMTIVNNTLYITTNIGIYWNLGRRYTSKSSNMYQIIALDYSPENIYLFRNYFKSTNDCYISLNRNGLVETRSMDNISAGVIRVDLVDKDIINISDYHNKCLLMDRKGNYYNITNSQYTRENTAKLINNNIIIDMKVIDDNIKTKYKTNKIFIGKNIIQQTDKLYLNNNGQVFFKINP
jgi:hypothetical protein